MKHSHALLILAVMTLAAFSIGGKAEDRICIAIFISSALVCSAIERASNTDKVKP